MLVECVVHMHDSFVTIELFANAKNRKVMLILSLYYFFLKTYLSSPRISYVVYILKHTTTLNLKSDSHE